MAEERPRVADYLVENILGQDAVHEVFQRPPEGDWSENFTMKPVRPDIRFDDIKRHAADFYLAQGFTQVKKPYAADLDFQREEVVVSVNLTYNKNLRFLCGTSHEFFDP